VFPDLGSSQQQAAVIVGFFLPLVLAIPIQGHWPNLIRTLFAVAAYAAAGAIIAAASGSFTGKDFWQVTLEVLTLGVIGYQGVWKPSGLSPVIERHTNVNPAATTAADATPPTTSSLEPQIGQLLSASVRLLEHATARMAAAPTNAALTQEQLAEEVSAQGAQERGQARGRLQSETTSAAHQNGPAMPNDGGEADVDQAALGQRAGPPLDDPLTRR
jgi:hypothetical protein